MGAVRAVAVPAAGAAGVLHRRLFSRRSASVAASGVVGGDDVRRARLALRGRRTRRSVTWEAAVDRRIRAALRLRARGDGARRLQEDRAGDLRERDASPNAATGGAGSSRASRSCRAGMCAYGYSYQNHGLVGATPELLFQARSARLRDDGAGRHAAGRARGGAAARSEGAARASLRRRRHRPPPGAVRKHRDRTARHACACRRSRT